MSWWQSIVLGLVQGLAEFLPVSSSGHLVLARALMGIDLDNFMLFDLMLHLGTLLAVFCAFFREIVALFKPPFKTIGLIILASLPAAIVGFLLKDVIDNVFADATYLCFFFAATAVIMFLAEILGRRVPAPGPITWQRALCMGAAQAVAVLPGISRSGSTIFAGVVSGGNRKEVARFSFFMSMPVILGGVLLLTIDAVRGQGGTGGIGWYCYVLGILTAFGSGFLAIKWMMKLVEKANFKWFALYLSVLSLLTFLFYFLKIQG